MILGGIFPLPILSIYSAATFNGPITASKVLLKPMIIPRNSSLISSGLPRASNFPPTAAVTNSSVCFNTDFIIVVMFPAITKPKMIAKTTAIIIKIIKSKVALFAIAVLSFEILVPVEAI